MQDLDWVVGQLLKKLDDLGIADNTLVIFTTDNGAEKFTWPDGGTTPFRGETGLGWEGGFPRSLHDALTRKIKAGQVINGITSHEDVLPTVLAAAGVPDIVEKCKVGYTAGEKTFKVHLDGYNQLPYLTGAQKDSARQEFIYYGEFQLFAVRVRNWKVHFQIKDNWFKGTTIQTTVPQPVNLRADPFEQHMELGNYPNYAVDKLWTVMPVQAVIGEHLATYKEFPQRQKPADFKMEEILKDALQASARVRGGN